MNFKMSRIWPLYLCAVIRRFGTRRAKASHTNISLVSLVFQVMTLIQDVPVPVIAMVNGVATAAGCQLVASCDVAVATEKSTFATPGVNVGLFCSTPAVAIGRAVPRKVRAERREASSRNVFKFLYVSHF